MDNALGEAPHGRTGPYATATRKRVPGTLIDRRDRHDVSRADTLRLRHICPSRQLWRGNVALWNSLRIVGRKVGDDTATRRIFEEKKTLMV